MLKATTTEQNNCDEARGNRTAPQLLPSARLSMLRKARVLSLGLMALLYLITEGMFVETPEKLATLLISWMFFGGFLALLTLEEILG